MCNTAIAKHGIVWDKRAFNAIVRHRHSALIFVPEMIMESDDNLQHILKVIRRAQRYSQITLIPIIITPEELIDTETTVRQLTDVVDIDGPGLYAYHPGTMTTIKYPDSIEDLKNKTHNETLDWWTKVITEQDEQLARNTIPVLFY